LAQLRQRLVQVNPVFGSLDRLVPAVWAPFGQAGVIADAHFASPIENFYMTDPISRASQTMAQCTEAFLKPALPAAAAE
jgi:NADH-quinone oxidoreductase subunit G